jgi:hypothetical protein
LGVEAGQYFGAGNTWDSCESWLQPDQAASYAQSLGAPTGPPLVRGGRVTSSFLGPFGLTDDTEHLDSGVGEMAWAGQALNAVGAR